MKIWKNFFQRLSLMQKLLLMFLTAMIAPLCLITIFFYQRTEQRLLEITYKNMYSSNQQISSNVKAQLDRFQQISSLIYTDETMQGYLTQVYTKDYPIVEAYNYIDGVLYSLLTANANIASIRLYVNNETIPEDGLFLQHITLTPFAEQYLDELSRTSGGDFFSNVIQDESGGNIIYLGRILNFNTEMQPYGMVTIGFNEDLLYSLIEKEEQTKSVYLLNENDIIISASDKSLLNERFSDVFGQQLQQNQEIITIAGEPYLLVYNTMYLGWKTVSLTPLDEVMQPSRKTAVQIVIIAVVSLVISTCMVVVIARYLSRRLNKLNRQAAQIEQGNFTVWPSDYDGDEIGQLGAAFNQMSVRLKTLIDELYVKELAKRDAELYALQSQINPHFLYNTLSGISSLAVQNGDQEVSRIVNHLARFYQISLNMGYQYIALEKELALTRHYIAIQHMRFGTDFTESWEIDDSLLNHKVLKLILQPFVENAINHARAENDVPLHITIRAYRAVRTEKCILFLEVEDDGCGMPDEQMKNVLSVQSSKGYGILNVHKRIQLAYGGDYGVSILSGAGRGTKIVLALPL
ncbi:cache domain-containing sensor histidine kinase [Allofournierella sp.]|uniref:cache domain-containing sensor histidine kinase n=1 Tax=Allofournierella sp. TaxID=1940256 RepID=UPI003AB41CBB